MAEGVTLGEGMRWGEIRRWPVRQCPGENPSRSEEVFPLLVSWKEGKARREEGSWGQIRPPSQFKWRPPRPGSWVGVPLMLQEGWNASPFPHALRLDL